MTTTDKMPDEIWVYTGDYGNRYWTPYEGMQPRDAVKYTRAAAAHAASLREPNPDDVVMKRDPSVLLEALENIRFNLYHFDRLPQDCLGKIDAALANWKGGAE